MGTYVKQRLDLPDDDNHPLKQQIRQTFTGALEKAARSVPEQVPGGHTGEIMKHMGREFVKAIPKAARDAFTEQVLSQIKIPVGGGEVTGSRLGGEGNVRYEKGLHSVDLTVGRKSGMLRYTKKF